MKSRSFFVISVGMMCLLLALCSSSCASKGKANPAAEGPLPAQVEHEQDAAAFKLDHPEQFPLIAAGRLEDAPELNVTGTVNPDVARNVPVDFVGFWPRSGDLCPAGR